MVAQAQHEVPMTETAPVTPAAGMKVQFLGFTEETPEHGHLLTPGEVYDLIEVVEKAGEEPSYLLSAANPQFDNSKRASVNNPKWLKVDVFADEIAVVAEAPATTGKSKGKSKGKGKSPAVAATAPAPKLAKPPRAGAPPATDEEGQMARLEHEDPEILAIMEQQENILAYVEELDQDIANKEWLIGGILYHAKLDRTYHQLDPRYAEKGGFEVYCNERLSCGYRKAMNLIEIYYQFNLNSIPGAELAKIGWTKAREIVRVMEEANAGELVTLAENSSVAELKESIRADYVGGKAGEATERVRRLTFKFKLFADQAELVDNVLQQTMETLGLKDKNQAFEHIIVEWASEHLSS